MVVFVAYVTSFFEGQLMIAVFMGRCTPSVSP
jgi:hypothetical protein